MTEADANVALFARKKGDQIWTEIFPAQLEGFSKWGGYEFKAEHLAAQVREDAPCALCGEMTNRLAGNGALWPVWFCHADGTGISRPHHQKCVSRLVFPDDGSVEQAGD